jgi:hypothetical protein
MAYPSTKHLILFTLLNLFPSAQSAGLRMSFTYQSRLNEPTDWFTMFTLCLAPLVTHIAFGLAKLVTLSEKNPPWTEKITQFSPISILWRYYAIAYRRLRATQWDAADMAACNAAFWDGKRWDGSEYMMIRSREYLTNRPDLSHVALISGSTLATIALILQGAQASFITVGVAVTGTINSKIGFGDGLPCLFLPIGFLGLLRLPAAYWLTNDFGYSLQGTRQPNRDFTYLTETEREVRDFAVRRRLVDTGNWKCICYRVWWIATISAVMGMGIYDILGTLNISGAKIVCMSVFDLFFFLMYLELALGCLLIHVIYVLRRDHVSTVIPCNQSKWYKWHTYLMIATAAAAVIAGSLETLRWPDGGYTTHPPLHCTRDGIWTPLNKTAFLENIDSNWEGFLDELGVK